MRADLAHGACRAINANIALHARLMIESMWASIPKAFQRLLCIAVHDRCKLFHTCEWPCSMVLADSSALAVAGSAARSLIDAYRYPTIESTDRNYTYMQACTKYLGKLCPSEHVVFMTYFAAY